MTSNKTLSIAVIISEDIYPEELPSLKFYLHDGKYRLTSRSIALIEKLLAETINQEDSQNIVTVAYRLDLLGANSRRKRLKRQPDN